MSRPEHPALSQVEREAGTQTKVLGPAALRDAGAVSMTTQGGPLLSLPDPCLFIISIVLSFLECHIVGVTSM